MSKPSEYCCTANLNLYDSPQCDRLATQAAIGRHLTLLSTPETATAVRVRLCEEGYEGWLLKCDRPYLDRASTPYDFVPVSEAEIRDRIPKVIEFTRHAMSRPNCYLWGGTIGPNYDCSGLMQAAFLSVGIWLPRDAYQQEPFLKPIDRAALQPGDLVFFGPPEKATHVGLYLGNNRYIHSSCAETGRNGIGIDELAENGDRVSEFYLRQLRGFRRVVESYCPF